MGGGDLKPKKRSVSKGEAKNMRISLNPKGRADNSHMPTAIGSQSHGLAQTNESKDAQKTRGRGDLDESFMSQGKTDDKVRSAVGDKEVVDSNKKKVKAVAIRTTPVIKSK